ncbi:unnamed protein product [Porites lobata]|uniref:C2H2-type domain-containing protein n=1 Tax=Porites lobata TaxID=104759 RepID=A0ABN8RHF9_9CNID|nr:unnamed protein product [Porites lobata]
MATLLSLYEGVTSWYTKMTILSIFAQHYTKTQLKDLVPGLTTWRIDQARKHAVVVGAGHSEVREPVMRYRLEGEKVDHFLDFISSPHYLQDVAYGTRKIKMSSGECLEIPDLVRTVISSRMVKLYQLYCSEVGFQPLGRSTLFSILKICAASQKKSPAGLDNVTSEGASAFDTLEKVVETMTSLGSSLQWADNVRQRVRAAKRYLKADYKLHVLEESPCADHCIRFALSSDDVQYKTACDHEHTMQCDRCLDCANVAHDIIAGLDSGDISFSYQEQKEELKYDIEKATERIMDWKSPIVRATNQEKAKINILDNLTERQVLVVMDWTMKWLPRSYRETQAEWFGKKGVSWHVSACITRPDNEEAKFDVRTFVHILDKGNQDWFAVLSILEDLVQQLKRGCHDVITARQLKEAIDSYGGIKGCRASVIELDTRKQTTNAPKLSGISQLNNFEYTEDGGMTVSKAFKVGEGRKISKQELAKVGQPRSETGVKVILPFCDPVNATGLLKKASTRPPGDQAKQTVVSPTNDEGIPWFTCPEQGCIKTFRTNQTLQRHLDFGRHEIKLHEESQYDQIRHKWAEHCLSLKPQNPSCALTASSSFGVTEENVLSMGWAQTKSKRRSRFSVKVKNYLLEQFMIGEETGRKVTPAEASARMRTVRTEEGARIFGKDEWLTPQQVNSYFSRLAAMKKIDQQPAALVSLEEDAEAIVERSERYHLRRRVLNQLTL